MFSKERADVVDLLILEMDESVACDPAHLSKVASANRLPSAQEMPEFVPPVHGDHCQRWAAVVRIVLELVATKVDAMALGAGNGGKITPAFEVCRAGQFSPARTRRIDLIRGNLPFP